MIILLFLDSYCSGYQQEVKNENLSSKRKFSVILPASFSLYPIMRFSCKILKRLRQARNWTSNALVFKKNFYITPLIYHPSTSSFKYFLMCLFNDKNLNFEPSYDTKINWSWKLAQTAICFKHQAIKWTYLPNENFLWFYRPLSRCIPSWDFHAKSWNDSDKHGIEHRMHWYSKRIST